MNIDELKNIQEEVIRKSKIINIVMLIILALTLFIIFKMQLVVHYYIFATIIMIILWAIIRCMFLNPLLNSEIFLFKNIHLIIAHSIIIMIVAKI